jgi:quinol monooxygenase YgiN
MIGLIATFTVTEENAAAFEAVATELASATRAGEPGNKLYQLVRNQKEPTQFRMMELYADQAAVEAHMASDWFKAAGPKLMALIEGRMLLERYNALS